MPEIDLRRIEVRPLAERRNLTRLDDVLVDPDATPGPCEARVERLVERCAAKIGEARRRSASVLLIYGAHLIRNGAARVVERLVDGGWVTHLATNGAGAIHDWEFAYQGQSSESVRQNVADGTFGAWDETGTSLHLAIYSGSLVGEGFGESVGRLIASDGVTLPEPGELRRDLLAEPDGPRAAAYAEVLRAMKVHGLRAGHHAIRHPGSAHSVLGHAWRRSVPATVHPGIGYDIVAVHPMFNGAAIGRAAGRDFEKLVAAVEGLDGGVVLSIGSAIMGPQVFEKGLSCVNNLRRQCGRGPVQGHSIFVVDLQPGTWDWSRGEPPATDPAYYLRFCKSYARMGGAMHYVCCDNVTFMHHVMRLVTSHQAPAATD